MKLFLKAALGVVACLAIAVPAMAQCSTGSETFSCLGAGPKIRVPVQGPGVTGPGAEGAGNEIGRFWQSDDSSLGNNFGGGCPSNDGTQDFGPWWQDANSGAAACTNVGGTECRGIRGAITGLNCDANTCPQGPLTVVVEDYDVNGPPGVLGTAYYIAWSVAKDIPGSGSGRRWDYAWVDNPIDGAANTGVPMVEFPSCTVTGSSKIVDGVNTDQTISDAGVGALAVDVDVNALPDATVIAGYNVCVAEAPLNADPGRDRSSYNCGPTLPYVEGADLQESIDVVCSGVQDNAFVAIGLTFEGGATDVPSALVGRACEVECDPMTADPKPIDRPKITPNRKPKPTRTGR